MGLATARIARWVVLRSHRQPSLPWRIATDLEISAAGSSRGPGLRYEPATGVAGRAERVSLHGRGDCLCPDRWNHDRQIGGGESPRVLPDLCLLYTSPSPRDGLLSRMPSSA